MIIIRKAALAIDGETLKERPLRVSRASKRAADRGMKKRRREAGGGGSGGDGDTSGRHRNGGGSIHGSSGGGGAGARPGAGGVRPWEGVRSGSKTANAISAQARIKKRSGSSSLAGKGGKLKKGIEKGRGRGAAAQAARGRGHGEQKVLYTAVCNGNASTSSSIRMPRIAPPCAAACLACICPESAWQSDS